MYGAKKFGMIPALSRLRRTETILTTSQNLRLKVIKIVSARQRIYPSWWILRILLPHFIRKVLVARAWIHVVAKWERDQFCREVYSIETLLHITCQIISELKHPRYCFPKFVSIWPAPEVVDGIFEVCPPTTKFCPLVNKQVALGFHCDDRFLT